MQATARRSHRRKPQEDPNCTTENHGTEKAHARGCTCPSAVVAHERYLAARARPERREKDRATAAMYNEREAWVKRVTGGRLRIDPRVPWRGRVHTVDRFTVDAMVNGYKVPASLGEKIAAIARVEDRIVADSPWRARRILPVEIAKLLHLSTDREVYRVRQARARLRDQRIARRAADAAWRAAYKAAGADRRRG